MIRFIGRYCLLCVVLVLVACQSVRHEDEKKMSLLRVSENGRYFSSGDEEPFFWLGDTGWLLFGKLTREEAEEYLDDRKEKGFNVIQAMVLHSLAASNVYGDSALIGKKVSQPLLKDGLKGSEDVYDYWDHIDWIVESAGRKGIYMALVPVWGSNVKAGLVSRDEMGKYAEFLARRYREHPNIIWLNGGDIYATDSTTIWQILGNTIREHDPNHLITFHPRGRTQSSVYFHNEPWLDFNMFQSGHRRYDQDTASHELRYGEDNWRYMKVDYAMSPPKPSLDGEPSYEGIPHGLHDFTQPRWTDTEIRRYGYWSVFAGAAGHTYGHSAVMQMHRLNDESSSYGNSMYWKEAIDAPGASQMIHLKGLLLSRPYFERIPDQSLIAEQGDRYDYLVATRGNDYAFVYTYTGQNISLNMGIIGGDKVKASWFDPRTGETTVIGVFANSGVQEFDPPAERKEGNDWVLVLDSV